MSTGTRTIEFEFNTALTELGENGIFDEAEHTKKILPLRGKIMKIDGMTGCLVARYGVDVYYFPPAVDDIEEVERKIIQIFEEAAEENFFPLRGKKKVKITCLK